MNDDLKHIGTFLQYIPFFGALSTRNRSDGEDKGRPFTTRVVETIVIALITGGFSSYVSMQVLQGVNASQIRDLKESIRQEHEDTINGLNQIQLEINSIIGIQPLGSVKTHKHERP